jgi:PPOX class probable FMN-dependent enzyme
MNKHFQQVVESEEALRDILGHASEGVIKKSQPFISNHVQTFIQRSPFLLIGTSSATGAHDVSPRGDKPGFVKVLDDRTIMIPDRPGNRRLDTMVNIINNPNMGLIFLIPGIDETVRINGHAVISRDEALLAQTEVEGKRSQVVIVVEVREVFFHCAKAFRRSNLWKPEAQAARTEVPTLGQVLKDSNKLTDVTAEAIDQDLEEGYKVTMY